MMIRMWSPKKVPKLDEDNQKDLSEKEEDLSESEFQDSNQMDMNDDEELDEDILGSSEEEENGQEENSDDEENEIDDDDESTQEEEIQGPYSEHLIAIQQDQDEIDILNNQANQEILQVNRKWNAKKQPAYQKRNDKIAKIPGFWALVFSSHSELKKVFTYEDLKALENMSKLEIQEDSDEDGVSRMKMKFIFNPNPYFVNAVIEKIYLYPDPQSELPPSCTCTKINWRPDKNLVEKYPTSFFSWFCDQQDASADDVSEIIKDEIWNNPLQFYNKQNPSDTENDAEDSEEESDDDDDCVITGSKDAPPIDLVDDTSDEDEDVDLSDDDDEEGNWRSGGKTGGKSGGKSGKQHQHYDDEIEEDYEDDDEDIEVQDEEEVQENVEEVVNVSMNDESNSNDALLDDDENDAEGNIYQMNNLNNHNSSG